MNIRKANESDLAILVTLRGRFWKTQYSFGLRDGRRDDEEALTVETRKQMGRSRSALMVCEIEQAIVGYAFATLQVAPQLSPAFVRTIEEVFVLPKCGRKGAGAELVEAAFSALSMDDARSQIRILQDNLPAKAFWERLGFDPVVTIMERSETQR